MRVVITPEMLHRWATEGDEEITASGRLAVPSKVSAAWLATFDEDEPAGFATLADRIELEKRQQRTDVG